ncbi:uncharacterized protein yc1106_08710 [Curvularia clavata]|uniref:Uncharacterized protein n=1 Tax=Curvularia clavata TaxID=95742 RepID=A0A9Q8ZG21_CURCL|nr:uncharacterized protein yc1106_08710 [Curvularia clavata]
MFLPALTSALALSTRAAPDPYAKVHNKCSFPVWVSSVQNTAGPTQMLLSGNTFSEVQRNPENGTGVSIQVTTTVDGAHTKAPILIMGYSWDNRTGLYYSLSTVNGFSFWGQKLRIHNTEGKAVQEIVWVGEPKGEYTAVYLKGEADITLELCDDFAE